MSTIAISNSHTYSSAAGIASHCVCVSVMKRNWFLNPVSPNDWIVPANSNTHTSTVNKVTTCVPVHVYSLTIFYWAADKLPPFYNVTCHSHLYRNQLVVQFHM